MSMSLAVSNVTSVTFMATTSGGGGGWLCIELKTQLERVPGETRTITEYSTVQFQTRDPKVFDHFRDIERVCNGPVGSLRAKPEGSEASDQQS